MARSRDPGQRLGHVFIRVSYQSGIYVNFRGELKEGGGWDLKRSEISWAAGMKLWQHLANVGINIYLRGSEKYLSRITGFFFSFILLRINIYGGCEKYLFRIIGFFFFFIIILNCLE